MIDSKDISVVVQGAIDFKNTPKCLASIRKWLPDSEIILSTWENSNITNLDYDVLLLNQDPGSFQMGPFETNNVKRQIYSTLQGLKISRRKYALKIRSDILLTGNGFTEYLEKFNSYDEDWHFLKRRIVIPSSITRDPRVWESPMCPSDWCSFGLLEDMLALWNIPFPSEEEQNWFKYHVKNDSVKEYYYPLISRYNPEQFIWINFVKKFKKELSTEHMFDINQNSIDETMLSFANNLVIISDEQFCIKLLKDRRKGGDSWHVITYKEFLKIYNNYAKGNENLPFFDFQRLKLIKYSLKSYNRIYKIACKNRKHIYYLNKELRYFCPLIHTIFKFLFNIFNNKAQKDIFYSKKHLTNKIDVSIVVPTHDNLNHFKETLSSLKNQEYKDFEIIISDDSSKRSISQAIIKELFNLYDSTNINIKYIHTKKNLGQSANTNQGLKLVEGAWTRILHSDDILHPSCLKDEINVVKNDKDIVAIYHNIIPFYSTNKLNTFSSYTTAFETLSPKFIIDNALHSYCAIPSCLLFSSELLNQIDPFNESLKRACDWDFWSRIVLYGLNKEKKIVHFFNGRIFYRIHEKSNTNKFSTILTNYIEYEKVSYMNAKVLKSLQYPPHKIFNYLQASYAYRKKRLITDYFSIQNFKKIFLLFRFMKYLARL